MTEKELRHQVVTAMTNWLGMSRAKGTHKPIIDIYNEHNPLPRSYKVKYSDNYCATGISAAAIVCDMTDIIPKECSCGRQVELFQKMGSWVENDGYIPEEGDVIYYDWDDTGKGDNKGWPEHVGLVVSVENGMIKVIECNKGGAVSYRSISVNGRYIRGFGTPDYKSKEVISDSDPAPNEKPASKSGINRTVIRTGYVSVRTNLNVRKWAGTEYDTCSFSPLKNGEEVGICDEIKASDGTLWYYIEYNGKHGFVSAEYIK